MKRVILTFVILLSCIGIAPTFAKSEKQIEALKAPFHVGENVMACGTLAQVTHLENVHYLNIDYPYPKQTLTFVIWAKNYPDFEYRFGNLDSHTGKRFCARGVITEYKDYLQIVIKNPQFLRLMK